MTVLSLRIVSLIDPLLGLVQVQAQVPPMCVGKEVRHHLSVLGDWNLS